MMLSHIHLDPVGGIAGDMFCAALLDAYPALLATVQTQLQAVEPRIQIQLQADSGHLRGSRFIVQAPKEEGHGHRHYRDILVLLKRLEMPARQRAEDIFRLLAQAEGFVHQVDPMEVAFHEVGNWDSIADIVSAAVLLAELGITQSSVGILPLGGGTIDTAHGKLPVPAPATAKLLEGFCVTDDGIMGERITPTGAAILRHLHPMACAPSAVLANSGCGFGSRKLDGQTPNCLRVLFFEPTSEFSESVVLISCEIDDQTPEDLALGLEHIRQMPDVLSVHTASYTGKQGRLSVHVEVLTTRDGQERVIEALFSETTTLGLRYQQIQRRCLAREQHQVAYRNRSLAVKSAQRGPTRTAKTELREVADIGSAAQRQRIRQAGEDAALTVSELKLIDSVGKG